MFLSTSAEEQKRAIWGKESIKTLLTAPVSCASAAFIRGQLWLDLCWGGGETSSLLCPILYHWLLLPLPRHSSLYPLTAVIPSTQDGMDWLKLRARARNSIGQSLIVTVFQQLILIQKPSPNFATDTFDYGCPISQWIVLHSKRGEHALFLWVRFCARSNLA